jgi:hypothetical protein
MRLADMHRVHPKQIEQDCPGCGAVCGIYPSGQAAMRRDPSLEIMCSDCQGHVDVAILAPGAELEPFESVNRKLE